MNFVKLNLGNLERLRYSRSDITQLAFELYHGYDWGYTGQCFNFRWRMSSVIECQPWEDFHEQNLDRLILQRVSQQFELHCAQKPVETQNVKHWFNACYQHRTGK